jgi:hypothetical protein
MDNKPPFSKAVKEYTMEKYVYDEQGNEILECKYVWKYDKNKKISKVQHYDSNNKLSNKSYYIYDSSRNLSEILVKTARGQMKQRLIHEYKDNKLDQITDLTPGFRIVSKFDDQGNPIEVQNFGDGESQPFVTSYQNLYDQNNRLIEKRAVFPSENSEWINRYKYNDAGLLIEEQCLRHQAISITKHSYNEKGDLVLSEVNPGEVNNETLKREIVYAQIDDILEIKEYRKGWCYQNFNDDFGLTGITKYYYIR